MVFADAGLPALKRKRRRIRSGGRRNFAVREPVFDLVETPSYGPGPDSDGSWELALVGYPVEGTSRK